MIADVVIAGHAQHRSAQLAQRVAAVVQVVLVADAVEREVAGVDDHVVVGAARVPHNQFVVATEPRGAPTEVRVGQLEYPCHRERRSGVREGRSGALT